MEKYKFILCKCSTEGILISKNEENGYLYLSFFQYGYNPLKMSWKQKLRYCYQVLIKGEPFSDQIVLNKVEIKELIKELNIFIKNTNKKESFISLGK